MFKTPISIFPREAGSLSGGNGKKGHRMKNEN